ncbi:MAG: PAS domain S-box protein [Rhodospirillaceae bacterium]|nr:PAS domain S-box protein [Rhodospirillaceae bacterium]
MVTNQTQTSLVVRYAIFSALVMSALVGVSLMWNIDNLNDEVIRLSTMEAESNWKKDQSFRQWATRHGGLYVRPNKRTPPNPYLAHLPNRDLKAADGSDLTLMNPAYMMRQMTGEFEEMYGVKGKITGQILLNPINKADPWEMESLKAFDRGIKKVVKKAEIDGAPYLRLMRPMVMKKGCVQCHGHLGFKVGDIRGGVSVSIPLAPYFAGAEDSKRGVIISHGSVWFGGLLVIGFMARRRLKYAEEHEHAQMALREAYDGLEKQVAARTQELTTSEANLKEAQSIASLGSWSWQIKTGEIVWSDELYRIFGLAPDGPRIIRDDFRGLIHPDDQQPVFTYVDKVLEKDDKYDTEYRIVRPNGDVRFIHSQGVLYRDEKGEPESMSGVTLDITERRKSEQTFRENAKQLETMFGTMAEGIVTISSAGKIEIVNPVIEEMFGYTRQELVGQNVKILMSDNYQKEHDKYLKTYQKTGVAKIIGIGREVTGERKDGSIFPINLTVSEFKSASETKFIGTLHDLTTQKETEQQLVSAKQEAEAANLAKSTFLAAASHDVRQPLQAMGMFLSVLSDKISSTRTGKDESIQTLMERMDGSVSVLNGLFDSLLDISKLEAQTLQPEISEFDIGDLMSRLAGQFDPQVQAKGLHFKSEILEVKVRSDEALLSQILSNFLGNALRYTNAGEIFFGACREGNDVNIEIKDTGIGIPKDKVDHIFNDFYQVGNQQRDRTQGLGLGLAIAKRTADLLDLPLTVTSEEGQGSTFGIRLPLERRSTSREQASETTLKVPFEESSKTILVIDDDPTVLESLQLRLEAWNHKTIAANSLDHAQDLIDKNKTCPDVIISDLRLSEEMDGVQVIEKLRTAQKIRIPGIILTGDTSPDRLKYIEQAGLSVLHKPIKADSLAAILKETLDQTLH